MKGIELVKLLKQNGWKVDRINGKELIMTIIYPAIFHEEDGYWVEFPDLPGCQTCGSTLEETMEFAEQALGLYLASRLEHKENIPAPSKLKDIDPETGQVSYVATDINKYRRNTKAVKKTLSIPAWLAEEAEHRHLSLSKVLQDGLYAALGIK